MLSSPFCRRVTPSFTFSLIAQIFFMHAFDGTTPVEETLKALDHLVSSGKIRYIGCSNFSGWHLMKSLSISKGYGWERYISYQGYYCVIGREYEWELMPLGIDQGRGSQGWSPLSWGAADRQNPAQPATYKKILAFFWQAC